jgi:pimeloyl-ACP methyl ester carboxylesterase
MVSRVQERRAWVVVVLATALLALPAVTARARQTAPSPTATVGPLIAGEARFVSGVFAWTDYAYDDRGPDTNTRPGGDAAYPADMNPNNVADLIQLQVRAESSRIGLAAVLETLTPDTHPVVGVAFDSDNNPKTGAAALPGSWTPSASLGMDRLAVLKNGTGEVWSYDGARGWGVSGPLEVTADRAANTLRATLPFKLPGSGALRTVGAVGYEYNGQSWLDGSLPVHDLAFVPGEDPTTPYLQGVTDAVVNFAAGGDPVWQDYQQSAILAGTSDPAPAVAAIDITRLRRAETDAPSTLAKGFHTFLYRSALDLGEGIQGTGTAAVYAGPYQPYLIWASGGATDGLPLVLYMHGSSQTHLSAVNTAPYDRRSQDPTLGLPDAFFDDFQAVVAWPLGRGPTQNYSGASQQDVLDVNDDVVSRLRLNPDRVMLAGLSLGGMGTFRLAELYPDRWSIAYSDVGYDASVKLPENLTALPLRFQNGVPDYLVTVNNAVATRQLLEAAGTVDYRSFLQHQRHHQPAVALAKCIYQLAFGLDRVKNPARVRYTIDPALFQENDATGLHLTYDGAYWVDGMKSAGAKASVDLTSLAFGYVPTPQATTNTEQQNITAGRDFCGANPDVNTHDTWDEQAKAVQRVPVSPQASVTGTLTNLTDVSIDAGRAWNGAATGVLTLTTDRSVTLRLTGLVPGSTVQTPGTSTTADAAGVATVALAAGTTTVTVT